MASQQNDEAGPYCSRFGMIAVEHGFITREQLMLALDEQVADNLAGRRHRVIGAICFDYGWMTPKQIEIVLNAMFKIRTSRSEKNFQETAATE